MDGGAVVRAEQHQILDRVASATAQPLDMMHLDDLSESAAKRDDIAYLAAIPTNGLEFFNFF